VFSTRCRVRVPHGRVRSPDLATPCRPETSALLRS
jgi:hypothetical protein